MFRDFMKNHCYTGDTLTPVAAIVRAFRAAYPQARYTRLQIVRELQAAGVQVGKDSGGQYFAAGLSLEPLRTWQVQGGRLVKAIA